jgi:cytochrome c553
MNRLLPLLVRLAATTTAALTLASTPALATSPAPAPAQTKADPAKGQEIASGVCAACHGADGNSTISANPKLAGQHAEYLFKQMKDFKANAEGQSQRVNAVMNGMIAAQDEAQMRNLAAWFASQKQVPEKATNRETIEFGQRIYRAGDASKGLPACSGCHGPSGSGMPAQFPRVAGQFADYTIAQLKKFREGAQTPAAGEEARTNDPNKMMRMVAIKMTDAEIKAVADYIAGLR